MQLNGPDRFVVPAGKTRWPRRDCLPGRKEFRDYSTHSEWFRDNWLEVSEPAQNSRAPLSVFVAADKRFQVHKPPRRSLGRLVKHAEKKPPKAPDIRVRRTPSQAKDNCGQTHSLCLRR